MFAELSSAKTDVPISSILDVSTLFGVFVLPIELAVSTPHCSTIQVSVLSILLVAV